MGLAGYLYKLFEGSKGFGRSQHMARVSMRVYFPHAASNSPTGWVSSVILSDFDTVSLETRCQLLELRLSPTEAPRPRQHSSHKSSLYLYF